MTGARNASSLWLATSHGDEPAAAMPLETLSWVHWFNEHRLHSYGGDVPPAEFEAAFYAAQQTNPTGVGIK